MKDFYEHNTPRALANILRPHVISLVEKLPEYTESDRAEKTALNDISSIPSGGTHILIIGAGVAGIMAAIECKKLRISFLIVEKSNGFGGIWLHGCNHESKLQTTSHVYIVDSSIPHTSQYPYKKEVLAYLDKIVAEHGLAEKALFNTIVEDVEKSIDGFNVSVYDGNEKTRKMLHFDGILVCTGRHHVPHVPEWPINRSQILPIHLPQIIQSVITKTVMVTME